MIEIKNYTKLINKNVILNNINLNLEEGNVYGLVGVNGSGKTMLMRAICGLIYPTEGSILVDGKQLGKDIDFPESLGALIETPSFLSNMTAKDNLKLISIENDINHINSTIDKVGLDSSDSRKFKKYSLGMKQKLGIAGAILDNPKIIILDEPMNALDTDGVNMVKNIIHEFKENKSIIILACHNKLDIEELSDILIFIENGEIKRVEKYGDDINEMS